MPRSAPAGGCPSASTEESFDVGMMSNKSISIRHRLDITILTGVEQTAAEIAETMECSLPLGNRCGRAGPCRAVRFETAAQADSGPVPRRSPHALCHGRDQTRPGTTGEQLAAAKLVPADAAEDVQIQNNGWSPAEVAGARDASQEP